MSLSTLPSVLWTRSALELVVGTVSRLVKLDQATELLTKGSFARVAVEIDLRHHLVLGADVSFENSASAPFWQ